MNKKIIYSTLIASLGLCVLSGCGGKGGPIVPGGETIDLSVYKKDLAITELNNDSYSFTKTTLDHNYDLFNDYYYDFNTTSYYSIYTNEGFRCSRGYLNKKSTKAGNTYYVANGQFYDAFGREIENFRIPSYSDTSIKYYICAVNSPLYKKLSGLTDEQVKDSKELRILEIELYGSGYSEYGAFVKEKGDTRIQARNYFTGRDLRNLMFDEDNMIDNLSSITEMNETEFLVTTDDEVNRVTFKDNVDPDDIDEFETNVQYNREVDSEDSEYDTIITIKFPGTTDVFKYQVKDVNMISNDFDFVQGGRKYDSRIVLGGQIIENPKCHFAGIKKSSKDNTYSFLLAKKIKDDGVLSNKNYVVKVDSELKMSKLIEDVSLFTEKNYIFNDELKTLDEDSDLLVLNDSYVIIKNKYNGTLTNTDGNSNTFGNKSLELVSKYAIDDYYLYKTKKSNGDYEFRLLQGWTGNTYEVSSSAEFVDMSNLIYKAYGDVYVAKTNIGSYDDDVIYTDHSYKSFNEDVTMKTIKFINTSTDDELVKLTFTKD